MTTRRTLALGIDWPLVPMLAKLVAAVPDDEARWAFEIKWDGIRLLARIDHGELTVITRNLIDATARYPDLAELGSALSKRSAVLDGELVAFDASGHATFEALQQRRDPEGGKPAATVEGVGIAYMVFDVLALDGRSLLRAPYVERRAVLEGLALDGPHWHTPSALFGAGHDLLLTTREQGLEGIVGKRLDSIYEPGKRTGTWVKVKNQQRQEFVIGGWVPGAGKRSGKVGALVLGYWDGDDFVCAGKVGTGFTDAMLEYLTALLPPLARSTSPFTCGRVPREAQFIEPRLVGEIEFMEWTSHSGQLRHPSFKGLRADKDPRDVVREVP
jgi:bifunctional non-homologous end joining protein LigD